MRSIAYLFFFVLLINASDLRAAIPEDSEFAWSSIASLPEPRSNAAVVRHGEAIYIIGGHGSAGASNLAWEFHPKDKSWKALPNMAFKRFGHCAVVFDDKIYVFGGSSTQPGQKSPEYLRSVEVFDIETQTWGKETPMPIERARVAATRVGNKIYLFGGENSESRALARVESFQPSTQNWQRRKDLEIPASRLAAVTLNERAYVLGGSDIEGDSLKAVFAYDPDKDTWTVQPPLSVPRKNLSAVVYDGQIVAAGGWHREGKKIRILDTLEFFSPAFNKWLAFGKLSTPRDGARAVAFEKSIYLVGGFGGDGKAILDTLEEGRWYAIPWTREGI
jgi:N-acetylneuraminic acid mutarotase